MRTDLDLKRRDKVSSEKPPSGRARLRPLWELIAAICVCAALGLVVMLIDKSDAARRNREHHQPPSSILGPWSPPPPKALHR